MPQKLHHIEENAEKAANMLKLLANKHRLMILCQLVNGRESVGSLAKMLDLSSSAVSQHLSKMRKEELVSAHKEGQMVYYQLSSGDVEAILSTLYLIYCR